jgi:hypothetical protein
VGKKRREEKMGWSDAKKEKGQVEKHASDTKKREEGGPRA